LKLNYNYIFIFICFIFPQSNALSQNISLKINGTTTEETKIIDSLGYKTDFSNLKLLTEEITTVQNKLNTKGYIENKIVSTKTEKNLHTYTISLNKKYNTIYLHYDGNIFSRELISEVFEPSNNKQIKTTISNIENKLNKLNSSLINNGYPFSKIHLTDIKKNSDSTLQAKLKLTTGNKRNIENIIVKGYEKFPASYIKHFLNIKKDTSFKLEDIKEKMQNLNQLRFTSQTKTPEVLFTKDSTTLYLYLEKTKSNTFDGFLGFGTNEETNKLEFDGYLNLNLINNLNFGEEFSLIYKSDENDQKTFNVNTSLPYIFKSPIGTEFSLNIFKKDSSFTTTNQSAKLFYQINPKQRVYLGIESSQSNNLLDNSNNNNIQDFNSNNFSITYNYKNLNPQNLLFQTKTLFNISLKSGKREYNSISEKQESFSLNTFNIFNLNQKNSIYIKIDSRGIISDSFLENELLRFGGINSIRGFEENSLSASLFGVINTEYRFLLNNSIYLHSILDIAYLENDLIQNKEKLFGFGFGFGLTTKAGLLKFNYANGKTENQKFKLNNSKIHLSLNAFF
jgi:outer membrane protein assembly factor BamA